MRMADVRCVTEEPCCTNPIFLAFPTCNNECSVRFIGVKFEISNEETRVIANDKLKMSTNKCADLRHCSLQMKKKGFLVIRFEI